MNKIRYLFLALLCMIFLLVSCQSEEHEETETVPPAAELPVLVISADDKTDYVIVRPDEGSDIEVSSAMNLRDRIKEEYGIQLQIVSDLETASYSMRQEKEIVLGKITSEGTLYTVDRDKLGKHGYTIMTAGEKIIIAANSSSGYRAAIEDFVMNMLTKNENVLSVPANTAAFIESSAIEATMSKRFDVADRTDLVGICYSTWFDPIIDANGKNNPPNITEVLEGKRSWGGLHAFHYWAEPALGYYRSTDKAVIRQHMTWLTEAGVDFIIIDNTNTSVSWKTTPSSGSSASYWEKMITLPTTALLDTIVEMREEGLTTPYVVMWNAQDANWSVTNAILKEFYSIEKYDNCWVYWDDKPFVLTTNDSGKDRDDLVWRKMWGLQGSLGASEWCFLNAPAKISYDRRKNPEQVGVCTAAQQTYMSLPTATGRNGGKTFYDCWQVAFNARPKFVTITWWNEWAAQRFEDEQGNSLFVDNYNAAYSRDIEPMKGGHGDQYYQWMKQYIAAYKAHEDCPKLYE